MESEFNPYLKWLGIPLRDQPPSHYRLLGIELFESDSDIIAAAAERGMLFIRTFAIGPRSNASQKILNEIVAARNCLLNQGSKAKYDATLKKISIGDREDVSKTAADPKQPLLNEPHERSSPPPSRETHRTPSEDADVTGALDTEPAPPVP